jgi:signal transduction histidine kinase
VVAAAGLGWVVGRRAVRPLGLALTSQRRFVADASHELRTPLAILHTRAQLLQRQPATDQLQRQEIDQLVDDARVLTDIVNDLLLSAEMQQRPGAGQNVDLDQTVAEIKRSFAGTAERAGVDLVVDTGPATRHVISGAPSALRRAISALVDNALGHVDAGGTVTITLNGGDDVVRVIVADTGDGLDPALAAELTQRFRRGPGVNGNGAGAGRRLGLGLALVEEVVHAHRGTMQIDGRPGAGASVTLTFPSAPA